MLIKTPKTMEQLTLMPKSAIDFLSKDVIHLYAMELDPSGEEINIYLPVFINIKDIVTIDISKEYTKFICRKQIITLSNIKSYMHIHNL